MKAMVEAMEQRIVTATRHVDKADDSPDSQKTIHTLAMEAILLTHQNYQLRQAIDDHRFFHSMLQLEYDHVRLADWLCCVVWRTLTVNVAFAARDSG